jgi:YD repeat-containing protein
MPAYFAQFAVWEGEMHLQEIGCGALRRMIACALPGLDLAEPAENPVRSAIPLDGKRFVEKIAALSLLAGWILCLALTLTPSPTRADVICGGGQNCRLETQHPISILYIPDGTGGTTSLANVDQKHLPDAVKLACNNYAAAEALGTPAFLYTFNDSCSIELPLPTTGGGYVAQISVNGTIQKISKDTGTVVSTTTSSWALLTATCTDSASLNYTGLGNTAQCYCKYGRDYWDTQNTCIYAIDKWIDPGKCPLCTAASTPEVFNPIDPLFGAKIVREPLGFRIGRESISIVYDSRTRLPYASPPSTINGTRGGPASTPPTSFGGLGLWTTSVHKFLTIQRANSSSVGFTVQAYRGDGRAVTFNHPSANSYSPVNPATRDQLVPVLDGSGNQTSQVRLIDTEGNIEVYELGSVTDGWYGTLQSIAYVAGGGVTFTYGTLTNPVTPLLTQIVDDQGRSVQLVYEPVASPAGARLNHIVAPDGNSYQFGYDANGNLAQILWPDGKVRTYLYERPDFTWAITGIIDENNSRYATYSYDEKGVPISTEHANGAGRHTISYAASPGLSVVESQDGLVLTRLHSWTLPQDVRVTGPNGNEQSLAGILFAAAPALAGLTQAAGSGSAQASSAITYDAAGNRTSFVDVTGMRTCYAYDASNRETIRVEGLTNVDTGDCVSYTSGTIAMPALARMTRTDWYQGWRLPLKVTQPRRQTIYSYNDQGSPSTTCAAGAAALPDGSWLPALCQQVVKATLDDNGTSIAPTIDSSVQPVTATFAYDAAGRLLTSTDANSHTTNYTYYTDTSFTGVDPNATGHAIGDLHTVRNAANQTTTYTLYDKAGRLLQSIDSKGVVTDTAYWPRGWVHTVTVSPPSLSARTTTYTYDDAGQLKDVALPDSTTLHYDYDAAHRMYRITDARGNSVIYTLDNAGNRKGEDIKDSSGTLQRSITRSFDSLNRVQQVTGARM